MPNLDPEEPTVAAAVFGKQAEDFLQSDIGDYLLQRAKEEEAEGIELLVKASLPSELETARAQIWRARSFQAWLGQAIERGQQALMLIEEESHG